MQKLYSLQLEAPITKVIMLLSDAATDTTNLEAAAQINKVRLTINAKNTETNIPPLFFPKILYITYSILSLSYRRLIF